MRLGAGGWILAGCVALMSQSALGVSLSAALKTITLNMRLSWNARSRTRFRKPTAI